MIAKLRSCCRIAAPVGGSAAWPTSEEPARIAMRAAQNGTFQRVSRRSTEDVIGGSHDSTAYYTEGARRHVHRAHLTTLALEVARGTRTRPRVVDEAAGGGGDARRRTSC